MSPYSTLTVPFVPSAAYFELSLSTAIFVPSFLNLILKWIRPLYFWYPTGALISSIWYESVLDADSIFLSVTISKTPSPFVDSLFFVTAPETENTAALSFIGVTPSLLVLINLIVYLLRLFCIYY